MPISCCSCQTSTGARNWRWPLAVVPHLLVMLSGRQCAGASTTGRLAIEFGDFATHRCCDHAPRLSVRPLRTCAHLHSRAALLPTSQRRSSVNLQANLRSEHHGQQRCRHRQNATCTASSYSQPGSHNTPNANRNFRTIVLLTAVFAAWCCVSTHTQTSSAFMSMTTALTDAGASSAGAETKAT